MSLIEAVATKEEGESRDGAEHVHARSPRKIEEAVPLGAPLPLVSTPGENGASSNNTAEAPASQVCVYVCVPSFDRAWQLCILIGGLNV